MRLLTNIENTNTPSCAIIETQGVEQKTGPFDTVVLAAGSTPVNELQEQVKGLVPEIYVIGDASKPGKILAAVEAGAETALK